MSKIYPYAGFWKRAIAFLIDGIILTIPMLVLVSILTGMQIFSLARWVNNSSSFFDLVGAWILQSMILSLLSILLWWLYHALMESGKHQATLGKMALGIKVVGAHAERISFARATGRFFGQWISGLPLYFGFYMAGFTQRRQALHDLMATTYVVDKNYQEGQELPELRFSTGGLIASILAALAPIVLYIGGVVIMMASAMSELKDDPDLQNLWKELSSEEITTQDPELAKLLNDSKRDLYLSSAQVEINRLTRAHIVLNQPIEKEGVTYSQSLEGYKASFKDPNGNEYEVLQRPGDTLICCLKGPGGKCSDSKYLYKPCDAPDED